MIANPGIEPEIIIAAVVDFFDIKRTVLCGQGRHAAVSQPRSIGMFLMRRYTHLGLAEIGARWGGRNSSTVLAACRRIERGLTVHEGVRTAVQQLTTALGLRIAVDQFPDIVPSFSYIHEVPLA